MGVDGGATKTSCVVVELEQHARACEAVDDSGNVSCISALGRSTTGSCNHNSVGEQRAKQNVMGSIRGALECAQQRVSGEHEDMLLDVKGICLCLSGTDRPEDKEMVKGWFLQCSQQDYSGSPSDSNGTTLLPWQQTLRKTMRVIHICENETNPTLSHAASPSDESECVMIIENDALSALCSGTCGERNGIVLIAGTGTIAVAYKSFLPGERKTMRVRAAGWGPAFGDGGSGFDIGYRALCFIARMQDGRTCGGGDRNSIANDTYDNQNNANDRSNNSYSFLLRDRVMNEVGAKTSEELLRWAYQEEGSSWARVATLARVVIACAEDGDMEALSIIERAADELASSVVAVNGKMRNRLAQFSQEEGQVLSNKIVIVGGVLRNAKDDVEMNILMKKVKYILLRDLPESQVVLPHDDPAIGAALLMTRYLLNG